LTVETPPQPVSISRHDRLATGLLELMLDHADGGQDVALVLLADVLVSRRHDGTQAPFFDIAKVLAVTQRQQ
jgi:hypothetical protein